MTRVREPSLLDDSLADELSRGRGSQRGAASERAPRDIRKLLLGGGAVLGLVLSGFLLARQVMLDGPNAGAASRQRAAIDAETGKVFTDFVIRDGQSMPWTNPETGTPTLFPAEECYWTRDGQAKLEPTYVLLNTYVGKPEPTTCPDCGRRVVFHNPWPPMDLLLKAEAAAGVGGGSK